MSVSVLHLHQHTVISVLANAGALDVKTPQLSASELRQLRLKREERIDEELAQSFPASDPPSWVQGVTH